MIYRKLAIIYFYTPANQELVKKDVEQFYSELNSYGFSDSNILVDKIYCPTASALNKKLQVLVKEPYGEIYLHFSGHGMTEGIPYGDWILENENFAVMLDHPKIISCFFSACQSAQLAKIVAHRKIPVVIGTSGDNNIENAYAIAFQKSYYQYLAEKKSFKQAFEESIKDIEVDNTTSLNEGMLVRSLVPGNIFESSPINKLQIIFSSEDEKERHLIYPTIADEISFVPDEKQILFVYATNDNVLKDFEETFNEKGFHDLFKLFLLKNIELDNQDPEKLKQIFILREIKVLFLIQSESNIFEHTKLKQLFDDRVFLTEFDNLKLGLAVKDGIQESAAVKGSDYFEDELSNLPIFRYQSFKELFENNKFEKFINELTVNFSERFNYIIRQFPCNPTRGEVLALNDPQNYVCAFFAPKKYENIIYFIINWLSRYLKIQTPIIIADHLHKEQLKPTEAITEAIKNTYKDQPHYSLFNLTVLFPIIVSQKHILVCRTNLDEGQLETLKDDLRNLLTGIDEAISGLAQAPDRPTFLFFINSDNFSFVDDPVLTIAKTKSFSALNSISETEFDSWIGKMQGIDMDFDQLLNNLSQTVKPQLAQDVVNIIELVCEGLKVPKKQILNIS